MDDSTDEQIEYIIFNIGIYSKGSLTVNDLEAMPLPKVLRYSEYAERITKEAKREIEKQQRSR